jgi:diaminohydroxyphosphoribosylaminopyrimidine deaminase/5-amino-6-(5-phosphoribosylamino)uracil reductase
MDHLGQRCCNEVLLEAGAGVAGAFVSAGLIDELVVYLAPDLLGSGGRGMFVLRGIGSLSNRICFEISDVQQLGRDLRVTLQPNREPSNSAGSSALGRCRDLQLTPSTLRNVCHYNGTMCA